MPELLEVKNLSVSFFTPAGEVQAVRNVSFSLKVGEVLALVGESGCGKSVLCRSVMKLLPQTAKIKSGSILVNGADITHYRERDMYKLRGKLFSMVFQDPMTSLNPAMSIGAQIGEAVRVHRPRLSREALRARVLELMALVGIDRPEDRMDLYPHHFSGGMCQRAVLAIALAGDPAILFADEPTTALDVTIQAQIIDLLKELQRDMNMSILLITHDFGVVSQIAERVAVMYAGKIVEEGPLEQIFEDPWHPYTKLLILSIPGIKVTRGGRLESISGTVPNPLHFPEGCRFAPRCPYAMEICRRQPPEEVVCGARRVSCFLKQGEGESHE